jgi:hypothetical protein
LYTLGDLLHIDIEILPNRGVERKRPIRDQIMKKLVLTFLLLILPVGAQDFKPVRDGVEYAEATRGTEKEPMRAYLLRLEPTKVRLDVKHAFDAAIGLERTSSIAKRHGALAAINAGFFRLDTSIFAGDAAGILQIDGELFSESYADRVALGIFNMKDRTDLAIGRFSVVPALGLGKLRFAAGINRQRAENDLVIYTPSFGASTLTEPGGVEFVVRGGRVAEIVESRGSTPIPSDGFVVSVSGDRIAEIRPALRPRVKALRLTTWNAVGDSKAYLTAAEDVVGGVPRLVRDGKVEITWKEEKAGESFANNRHPRTAVAVLKDGRFLLVTVDGRQEGFSVGMSLKELADFLVELGAEDAMNLDGGGSTAMYLEGKLVNRPSDKEGERRVGDAILVFPRK